MINPSTYIEVDLKAVKSNLKEIRRLSARQKFNLPTRPKRIKLRPRPHEILAVVKADAYGHGVDKIAPLLEKEGVEFFGVSDLREGCELRKAGIKSPILLFESTLPEHADMITKFSLMPSVCTMQLAEYLNEYARRKRRVVDIHIKVDTGMGRLGIWHADAFDFIQKVSRLEYLRIMGVFTHFPAADTDKTFTKKQIGCLYELVTRLDKSGIIVPYVHAANSMGLAGYKTHVLNLSRPGLMLYGLYPHPSLRKHLNLKPAMSVKSKVIFLKDVPKGRSISYGRTFLTRKAMRIATVPIGYHDGYFRAFSNKSSVLIGGKRCPVLGLVTMDQIIVDVSHVPRVRLGSLVVILGKQKNEEVSADELAKISNTISYEIVCNLGGHLPRVYKF